MTELLEQAFAEASKLSPDEQNALVKWLLDELESERRWQQLFEAGTIWPGSPRRHWRNTEKGARGS